MLRLLLFPHVVDRADRVSVGVPALLIRSALFGLLVVWSLPVLAGLWRHWAIAGIEHGVVPVGLTIILLAVIYKEHRGEIRPNLARPALVLFVPAVLLVSVGVMASVEAISQFFWPVAVWSLIWLYTGLRLALRAIPAFCLLYFSIPFWLDIPLIFPEMPSLTSALQSLTVAFVSALVSLTGIPALIQDNLILVPQGTFEVAESCSGRSYLLVAIQLAIIHGVINLNSVKSRCIVLLAMVLTAIVMNWIRVFSLVMIGYFSDMQSSLVEDHNVYGWVLFSLVLIPMFWRGDVREPFIGARTPIVENVRTMPVFEPMAVALTVTVGLLLQNWTAVVSPDGREVEPPSAFVPPGFSYAGAWRDEDRPVFAGGGSEHAWQLSRAGQRVAVSRIRYGTTQQGREVMNSTHLIEGRSGNIRARRTVNVAVSASRSMNVEELIVADGPADRVVWKMSFVNGDAARSGLHSKLLIFRETIFGNGHSEVVVMSTPCNSACGSERGVLAEIAAAAFGAQRGATQIESKENELGY